MNSRMCGAGMLITSSFVIAFGHAVSANAAAPRVIMFYGGVLDGPSADTKRDLLSEAAFCGVEGCDIHAVRNGSVGQFS